MPLLNSFFYSDWFNWDKNLFQCINGHNSPFWDKVMWVITSAQFGVIFFLILSALTVWFYRKQSWKILLFIGLVALSADAFGARVLKPNIQRLRPSHDAEYHGDYQVHLLQKKDGTYHYGGRYSCPSNHAINYLTSSLLLLFPATECQKTLAVGDFRLWRHLADMLQPHLRRRTLPDRHPFRLADCGVSRRISDLVE